ncbi:caspase family protein [Cystobacter fuscus]|nr:caspase family protein [Cystobacter fuscus]
MLSSLGGRSCPHSRHGVCWACPAMRGQALIIGCQTYGLTGVLGDARRVAEALGALGFDVTVCMGEEATRERILQLYRRLIARCAPDEAAFVYYAGHGAWAPEPGTGVQFIVPADFELSTEEDFRGITALELSALLEELTSRTRNVTVVLDCCFASRMFRSVDLMPRALPVVPLPVVCAHLKRLQARGQALGGRHIESNPHAVRLVAAALDEQAYEYTNARGVRTGLLTDAFLEVLDEARGLRVSWGQIGRRIRERVLSRCSRQRPELEGPERRLLFQLEELEQESSLAYYPEHGHHWLRGGRLHGVREGDEYAVMPLGADGSDEARALAFARVLDVRGGSSRVALERRASALVPTGAPAFPRRSQQPRRAVVLEGSWDAHAPLLSRLREALRTSSFVRQASMEEREPVLAHVRLGERVVDVLDSGLDGIVHPLPLTPSSVPVVLHALELLARAQALRELGDGGDSERFTQWLELEWGRVSTRRAFPLPTAGACLHAGERVYVRLRARGHARLHVSVLDVGVGGAISLLNASQPSGMVLGSGRVETLGAGPDGTLVGLELEWPEATPRQDARPESLVVIASEFPVDLRLLGTSHSRLTRAPPVSLEQLMHGGGRDRYAVKHIRFWLDPRPLP